MVFLLDKKNENFTKADHMSHHTSPAVHGNAATNFNNITITF